MFTNNSIHFMARNDPIEEHTIVQTLDHFEASQSQATFKQRYWVNANYWRKADGPVFLYIGGEFEMSEEFIDYGMKRIIFFLSRCFRIFAFMWWSRECKAAGHFWKLSLDRRPYWVQFSAEFCIQKGSNQSITESRQQFVKIFWIIFSAHTSKRRIIRLAITQEVKNRAGERPEGRAPSALAPHFLCKKKKKEKNI